MEIAQYKKIQKAFENANKSALELLDNVNALDPNESLFGDVECDLETCEEVLIISKTLKRLEQTFNDEFMRKQTNRMTENRQQIQGAVNVSSISDFVLESQEDG